MPRFLALDWDHQQLHIVSAVVGRGGVRIQRAALWKEEQSPNPAEAEALGKLLRERLKDAGIPLAPVLFCIGRDRIILKEVRYPSVPPSEEPALVRFQAVKDLTDAPEEVIIDYAPLGDAPPGSEQKALALIVRRELLNTYQTLCRAAGLKLLGLAPRPYGTVACLKQVVGTTVLTPRPDPADATVAVLTVAEQWAEFCIIQGEQLLLARTLAAGRTLAGEVRRNLSVYGGQAPQHPVRAVYLAASGEQAVLHQRLKEVLLEVPVYLLDPFAGAERAELPPPGSRGTFAGAVGLLHAWSERRPLPINFVHPKQPKPPKDPNQRRLVFAGAALAALFVAAVGYGFMALTLKNAQLQRLYQQKASLDNELLPAEDDAKRFKALDDWTQTEIVWLDELYDLTDRFPDIEAIRLTALTAEPLNIGGVGKDKPVAKVSLKGITTAENEPIITLEDHLAQEKHYKVSPKKLELNTGGVERFRFLRQFSFQQIQVLKRSANQYVRQVAAPVEEKPTRGGTVGETAAVMPTSVLVEDNHESS